MSCLHKYKKKYTPTHKIKVNNWKYEFVILNNFTGLFFQNSIGNYFLLNYIQILVFLFHFIPIATAINDRYVPVRHNTEDTN